MRKAGLRLPFNPGQRLRGSTDAARREAFAGKGKRAAPLSTRARILLTADAADDDRASVDTSPEASSVRAFKPAAPAAGGLNATGIRCL